MPLLNNLLEDVFQVRNDSLILFTLLNKLLERRWKGFQSVKIVLESFNLVERLLFGFTYESCEQLKRNLGGVLTVFDQLLGDVSNDRLQE